MLSSKDERMDICASSIRANAFRCNGLHSPLPAIVYLGRVLKVVVDFVSKTLSCADDIFLGPDTPPTAVTDLNRTVMTMSGLAWAGIGFELTL